MQRPTLSVKGSIFQAIVVQLPQNPATAIVPEDFSSRVETFKQQVAELVPLAQEAGLRYARTLNGIVLSLPVTFSEFGEVEQRVGEMLSGADEEFERRSQDRPKELTTVLESFAQLSETVKRLRPARRQIVIEICGDGPEADALYRQLGAHAVSEGTTLQKSLVERYGYQSGVTSCCEREGYNPPTAATAAWPVHPVEPKYRGPAGDEEEPNDGGLQAMLTRALAGRGAQLVITG